VSKYLAKWCRQASHQMLFWCLMTKATSQKPKACCDAPFKKSFYTQYNKGASIKWIQLVLRPMGGKSWSTSLTSMTKALTPHMTGAPTTTCCQLKNISERMQCWHCIQTFHWLSDAQEKTIYFVTFRKPHFPVHFFHANFFLLFLAAFGTPDSLQLPNNTVLLKPIYCNFDSPAEFSMKIAIIK